MTNTPTPWKQDRSGICRAPDGTEIIISGCGIGVACGVPSDEERANGALVLRAVNSHAALKAALEEIERRANDMGGQTPAQRCSVIAGIARRALTEG